MAYMVIRNSRSLRLSPNNGVLGRKNAAAIVTPLSKARVVFFRTPKKMQARVCARGQKNEGRRTAENALDVEACARIVVHGYVVPDVFDTGSATRLQRFVGDQCQWLY